MNDASPVASAGERVSVDKAALEELLAAALDVVLSTRNSPQMERLAGAHHDVELAVIEVMESGYVDHLVGVCALCSSNVYHADHFPEAMESEGGSAS